VIVFAICARLRYNEIESGTTAWIVIATETDEQGTRIAAPLDDLGREAFLFE